MFRDAARVKLTDLVAQHGRSIGDDAEALESLLGEQWAGFTRERAVVITAARERVPSSLRAIPAGTPSTSLRATLARRLEDEQGLTPDAARWAVDTWSSALGAKPTMTAPIDIRHASMEPSVRTNQAAIVRAALAAAVSGAVACIGMMTWNHVDGSTVPGGSALLVVTGILIMGASVAFAWGIFTRRRGAATAMLVWHGISMVAGWFADTPNLERVFDVVVFVLLIAGARAIYGTAARR